MAGSPSAAASMLALRTAEFVGSSIARRMAAAWLAAEPALIQDAFASEDCLMSYRGKSTEIHWPFHSVASASSPSSKEATSLHAEGKPSLSQMRTCQNTCEREVSGLPAHGTRMDWSETIFPESQRSGFLKPARAEAARICQAVWTSAVRSERSFHD